MSENKYISLKTLNEYNKQMKETYIKPLEEKTKDCPRTEIMWKEISNGIYTSEPRADAYGLYGAQILYREIIEIPEIMSAVFDGVKYDNLPVGYLAELGYYCIGNLSKCNVLGLNYPDTGEPFLVAVNTIGSVLFTDLTQSSTHEIALSIPVENIIKLDEKYMPRDLIISLNKKVISVTFDISAPNTTIRLPHFSAYEIDWGDGKVNNMSDHIYTEIGKYVCKIFDVTSIDNEAFYGMSTLISVEIGEGVTSIGFYAFEDCRALASVSILNSATSISKHAFANCDSLTSITIPKDTTNLDEKIFYNCRNLTSVVFNNPIPVVYEDFFYGCDGLVAIYVPYGCVEAYKTQWAADGASQDILNKIVESDRQAMISDVNALRSEIEGIQETIKSYIEETILGGEW